ncbi:MAG: hypothetical protein QOI59_3755 [Gammaproteobacteria bacterium]|jgi:hypothetical protein|nr:hypothetical protein [Gammaproteobacteria bacterium]
MMISLAFLTPNLVKSAIDGRLPHRMGVVRLSDMPAEWTRVRVDVKSDRLMIELTGNVDAKRKRPKRQIEIPWQKIPSTRRREILVPASAVADHIRPIRSEKRALLVASIARDGAGLTSSLLFRMPLWRSLRHERAAARAKST